MAGRVVAFLECDGRGRAGAVGKGAKERFVLLGVVSAQPIAPGGVHPNCYWPVRCTS
jgi:hypothetical protein